MSGLTKIVLVFVETKLLSSSDTINETKNDILQFLALSANKYSRLRVASRWRCQCVLFVQLCF
jgi:hypothetical protein